VAVGARPARVVHVASVLQGAGDRPLAVVLALPLIAIAPGRRTHDALDAAGVAAPEPQHGARRQVGLGLAVVVELVAVEQGAQPVAVPGPVGALEQVGVVEALGRRPAWRWRGARPCRPAALDVLGQQPGDSLRPALDGPRGAVEAVPRHRQVVAPAVHLDRPTPAAVPPIGQAEPSVAEQAQPLPAGRPLGIGREALDDLAGPGHDHADLVQYVVEVHGDQGIVDVLVGHRQAHAVELARPLQMTTVGGQGLVERYPLCGVGAVHHGEGAGGDGRLGPLLLFRAAGVSPHQPARQGAQVGGDVLRQHGQRDGPLGVRRKPGRPGGGRPPAASVFRAAPLAVPARRAGVSGALRRSSERSSP
jgi:hypothetical protein